MLGISRIRTDRAAYYLSDLGRELPVDAAPAVWCGAAAIGLGLDGPIDPDGFGALLEGRHPRTSDLIGSGRAVVAAIDLTFATPKSVGVLFGLGGEDVARRIVASHADAVVGALSYLEQRAIVALRRAGPERSVMPSSGMVAGLFTHAVNRNLDPHLHSGREREGRDASQGQARGPGTPGTAERGPGTGTHRASQPARRSEQSERARTASGDDESDRGRRTSRVGGGWGRRASGGAVRCVAWRFEQRRQRHGLTFGPGRRR